MHMLVFFKLVCVCVCVFMHFICACLFLCARSPLLFLGVTVTAHTFLYCCSVHQHIIYDDKERCLSWLLCFV